MAAAWGAVATEAGELVVVVKVEAAWAEGATEAAVLAVEALEVAA